MREPMVKIEVRGTDLEVEVLGLHKLWALKSRLRVPLTAVKRARRLEADTVRSWWKGWRLPGTQVPGVIVAGSYRLRGEWHFWDVALAEHAIAIELSSAFYAALFVEVAQPDEVLAELARAGVPV